MISDRAVRDPNWQAQVWKLYSLCFACKHFMALHYVECTLSTLPIGCTLSSGSLETDFSIQRCHRPQSAGASLCKSSSLSRSCLAGVRILLSLGQREGCVTLQILAFRLGYLPTVAQKSLRVFQVHAAESPELMGLSMSTANIHSEPMRYFETSLLSLHIALTAGRRMSFRLASTLPGLSISASPCPGAVLSAVNSRRLGAHSYTHCLLTTHDRCQRGLQCSAWAL